MCAGEWRTLRLRVWGGDLLQGPSHIVAIDSTWLLSFVKPCSQLDDFSVLIIDYFIVLIIIIVNTLRRNDLLGLLELLQSFLLVSDAIRCCVEREELLLQLATMVHIHYVVRLFAPKPDHLLKVGGVRHIDEIVRLFPRRARHHKLVLLIPAAVIVRLRLPIVHQCLGHHGQRW